MTSPRFILGLALLAAVPAQAVTLATVADSYVQESTANANGVLSGAVSLGTFNFTARRRSSVSLAPEGPPSSSAA